MLIYIVDDNLDMCEFVSFVLVNEGYCVFSFSCPLEALEHLRKNQHQPAILITDYNMPHMNGYDLHHEIIAVTAALKTIVISGRDVQSLIGDLHFLQKPFRPELLLGLINAIGCK